MLCGRLSRISQGHAAAAALRSRWRHSDDHTFVKSHYEVLGVQSNASPEVIKNAFIAMSKQLHPDHNPSRPDLHKRFVVAAEAYRVLSRPALRLRYDESLRRRSGERSGGSSSAGDSATHGGSASSQAHGGTSMDEPFYWRDESLHSMRDRSKDGGRYYEKDRFYGVRGVARQSNHLIALVLLAAGLLGSMILFFISAQTSRWQQEHLDERHRVNGQLYQEIRRRALAQDNDIQKLLAQRRTETSSDDQRDDSN